MKRGARDGIENECGIGKKFSKRECKEEVKKELRITRSAFKC
jgi:hypothetical protein